MTTSFHRELLTRRRHFAIRSNGVICAPAAGALYWGALALAGTLVGPARWCFIAFVGSGLIFPLALALQKPLRADMMIKDSPLAGAGGYAFANVALGWTITIPAFHTDPQLAPLALGISMCLHLTATAWSMDLKSYLYHPLLRGAVVVALWYALPQQRFFAIPAAIALFYLVTIPFVLAEVASHKRVIASGAAPLSGAA